MKSVLSTAFFCVLAPLASAQTCSTQPIPVGIAAACAELQTHPNNSWAHYRIAEQLQQMGNLQSAANEYRQALNGDLNPRTIEFWAHIGLGKIFATTQQEDRLGAEYTQALAARDKSDAGQFEAILQLAAMGKKDAPPLKLETQYPSAEPIQTTPADYTDEARIAELEGSVLLEATIGEDGVAKDIAVSHSLGLGLDEKAIESAKQWLFPPTEIKPGGRSFIRVDFSFPAKSSRWHLISASFEPVEGTSRPTFLSARYPVGAGVSTRQAVEEGRLLGAIGRQATATVSFDINERGIPVNLNVDWMSETCWGPEAFALVEAWRFTPGKKDGKPARTHASVDLIWGPFNLSANTIENDRRAIEGRIRDKEVKASAR